MKKMPSTVTLLMIIIVISTIVTYLIPSGEFERTENAEGNIVVVAGTFSQTEQNPVDIMTMFGSIFNGIVEAADIIAFIFIIGGAFSIVLSSGAINAVLSKLINKLKGKDAIFLTVVMSAFAVGGATFGMSEEILPFIAIMIVAAVSMGYDRIVGVSIVLIGAYSGYAAGPLNPFNTGVAQGIADLPLFSGLGLRTILMLGALIISIQHILRYAMKIKKNPSNSLVYGIEHEDYENVVLDSNVTTRHKFILSILTIVLIVLIYGVLQLDWYFVELSALFIFMALIVGLINYSGDFNKVTDQFMEGAKTMTSAALLVGIARAILVILEEGQVIDTIIFAFSAPLENLNVIFAAWGMYITQGLINFVIPSSSGQAVIVMPIISSLADIIGMPRQVGVLIFSSGDGFWNMITPTHPVTMAALGLAGIPFIKWFKFAFPLVIKWSVWVIIMLTIAILIDWGPF